MKPFIQHLVGAAAVVIIIAGLKFGAGPINQILIAFLLAMVITPLPEWLIKKGVRKSLAILISLLVILGGGFLVSAMLASSVSNLVEAIPEYQEKLSVLYENLQEFAAMQNIDFSDLVKKININPDKIIGFTGKVITGLTNFFSSSFIIAMLVAFMIIELINYSTDLKKGKREESVFIKWLTGLGGDLRKYVNITTLTGVITGVLNFFFLLILGVDFAFLWAFLSFLMNFIPNIGFIISFIPPALIALIMLGWWQALVVFIGFWLINAIVENVIRPIFMKESLNISLLTTFLSLLIWGWILGMPGAVLGVPLTMVVMKIYEGQKEG
ncbi:MAG TPA: AI-2E family transporter [Bacteroidales bacterium]|nr:AI-2E family transporter [Bacteroidales bacterium]